MNNPYSIALDIGTSGIRAQAINLEDFKVISTAITLRHPLPGANVVDHLHFAIEVGRDTAHRLLIKTINNVLNNLGIDLKQVERLAVCGNPIQLSLFQNIEIRDLAYWGSNAIKSLNITPPSRDATTITAKDVGLDMNQDADILIPPAIKHEIGADALAMLYKSEILDKQGIYLVIDFGTNAEMALVIDDDIYTCSAAAGPAIEGQMIEKGKLASPGTICDFKEMGLGWKGYVLDNELIVKEGNVVDPRSGKTVQRGEMDDKSNGITGTGVIAAFSLGIDSGLISLPNIKSPNNMINLQDGIHLSTKDITMIGKALGAFRAAYLTLAEEANVLLSDVDAVYMAGASGFYVDPLKSMTIGQIPQSSKVIYQLGNTSLEMARDIAIDPNLLNDLQKIAKNMRGNHIMLATSETFEKIYSLELSIYEQGMPIWMYNDWLDKYGFQKIPPKFSNPEMHKIFERDIAELGEDGLKIVKINSTLNTDFDGCTNCLTCMNNCPENALKIENGRATVKTDLCNGMACLKCELSCPEKVFKFREFLGDEN
ncbi:MAG: methylamine methyltransferase corrinoid protein reductive activase [Methanobacterium sp. ERen5]|nr:MAG: methylamine methyltransferase corrinoid protein reductive activase [Methanobacterium sp. ERen5]